MEKYWLHKGKSKKLIVFYSGWGMDYTLFKEFASINYDVLMYYNYSSLTIHKDFSDDIKNYSEINLISWSMGTWMAAHTMQQKNIFANKIAINGTLRPVDNNQGIIEQEYQDTIDFFGPIGRVKFFKRMFNNAEVPLEFRKHKPTRTLEDQRAELIFLRDSAKKHAIPKQIFEKVILSTDDIITPSSNQLNFWSDKEVELIKIDAPHFPFYLWSNWDEILRY